MITPSERLHTMLRDVKSSFEGTAAKIMACYKQAINEGFDQRAARKLIIENVGLSDRQVRHYLPAEAKDMRHDPTKKNGKTKETDADEDDESAPNNTVISRLEQTLEQVRAENARLREQVRKLAGGKVTVTIPPKYTHILKGYIQRDHKFALIVKDGELVDVEVLDEIAVPA